MRAIKIKSGSCAAPKYNRASRLRGWKHWAIIDFDPVAARMLRSAEAVGINYQYDSERRVWSPGIREHVGVQERYNRDRNQFEADHFSASFDLHITKYLPLDSDPLTRKQVIVWLKEAIATLEAGERQTKRGKLKLVG